MIDLHTHILPNMDDGSRDAAQSHQMLEASAAQGVKRLVLSPHFYPWEESLRDFLSRREGAFAQISRQGAWPRLHLGAEVAYFSGISQCQELPLLRIEGTDLILIEMPFKQWSRSELDEVAAISVRTGLTPVLVHVERYRKFVNFQAALSELLERGVLTQCNAESLQSFFSARWLASMLREEKVHFLGSDCHNMQNRPPNMGFAVEKMKKLMGEAAFAAFEDNAESQFAE